MGGYIYKTTCDHCKADLNASNSVLIQQEPTALTSIAENGGGKGVLHRPTFTASCNSCGEVLKGEWKWR